MSNVGTIKAFFGLDPAPAVKGMKTATTAVKRGTKQINTSLRSIKRFGVMAFTGWGVAALGKDFVNAAMDMDSMKRSMAAAVGGMEKGRREMNFLREHSQKMGLSFRNAAKDFKQLSAAAKGTALEGEGIRKVWMSLQNATVALQLTAAETSGTVFAFKDMLSKGTVQAEELKRQLGNRLPGAFRLASKAMGMTTQELAKQMKMGKLMADEFLPALAKALNDTYAGAAVEASKSMRSEMNRMKSAWFDFQSLFMETSGLSNALAMSMRWVTKNLVGLNNGMSTFAEHMKVANGAMIMFIDMGMGGFINLKSTAESFMNTYSFLIGNISADGQKMWAELKTNSTMIFQDMANGLKSVLARLKNEFADVAFIAAANLNKIGVNNATTDKLFKFSDSLRASSRKTKKAIKDETAALMAKQKALIDGIKPAMTVTQWAENDLRITKENTKALKNKKQIIAEMHADNIKKTEETKKKLLGRKDLPETGGGIPEVTLSKWEKIALSLEKSFAKLGKKSTDIAKNIQDAFTSAFKGIEDALVQLVVKGKVDWRSLADSMLADMTRIAVRQSITGPLMNAFSTGIGFYLGGAGAGSGAGSSKSSPISTPVDQHDPVDFSFAKGGMVNEPVFGVGQRSGKSYSFAENGSEAVLNQNQIKTMGANKAVAVNVRPQINISTPPGTQATTQTSGDGMNMDILISKIEQELSSNMRRGSVFSDTVAQTYGLNRASGAFR